MIDYKKRMPKRSSPGRFWRKYYKFILILVTMYLIFFITGKFLNLNFSDTNTYYHEDVQINGNKTVSDKTILQICGFNSKNNNAVEIDPNLIAQKIMRLDFIRGVSITFRPPRVLNITIEERQPVAFVYGRGLNLIDAQGYLMPVPDLNISWDIPLISGVNNNLGKLGEPTASKEVYRALEVIDYLENEHPLLAGMISEINMTARDYIEIYLVHGSTRIRVNKSTFYKELYILKTYLANYYDWSQLKHTEYIDLRFADQVIVKTKA